MATRQKKTAFRINKERVLLACIPVVGSIIIALFATDIFHPNPNPNPVADNEKRISVLKDKAGKANDMIVYRRYDDLSAMMADVIKPVITKDIFNSVADSTSLTLGSFLKPIDTTHTHVFGNDNFFIKNQYQRGTTINQFIFDDNGYIFIMYTNINPN